MWPLALMAGYLVLDGEYDVMASPLIYANSLADFFDQGNGLPLAMIKPVKNGVAGLILLV